MQYRRKNLPSDEAASDSFPNDEPNPSQREAIAEDRRSIEKHHSAHPACHREGCRSHSNRPEVPSLHQRQQMSSLHNPRISAFRRKHFQRPCQSNSFSEQSLSVQEMDGCPTSRPEEPHHVVRRACGGSGRYLQNRPCRISDGHFLVGLCRSFLTLFFSFYRPEKRRRKLPLLRRYRAFWTLSLVMQYPAIHKT